MFTKSFVLASFYLFKEFINFELLLLSEAVLKFSQLDLPLCKKKKIIYTPKIQCFTQVQTSYRSLNIMW